jgi:c(7)-type cytochrome triheme protein
MRPSAWLLIGITLVTLTAPAALAVEGDVVLKREGTGDKGTPPAVFPHWSHRIRYRCYACHPTPFPMRAGATAMTMDALQEGKFCGICHDDKTAWGMTIETCNRCHVPKQK